ncbi:acyloxyacyl hydrolase [Roseiarcaceae bacterium H3SJ34-1]|uniref:acyloxyacyl hydrolase n=1 Tax=Terripilifer ovatus TaxID=3032367 RepID=UPI003AB99182|nr:acyloxyacyl hydrolase [Roseiarcaceae bacterium H3SJ34-1]
MRLRRCAAALPVFLLVASLIPIGLSSANAVAGERGTALAGSDPAVMDEAAEFQRFELRLGTFVHDSLSPERGSADINGEILFAPFPRTPGSSANWLVPRLHVGATVNTAGKTSIAYAGFTWTYDISQRLFIEGAFGGALNNSRTGPIAVAGHNAMGCSASFHEAASVGYRITRAFSVLATVEHSSNAGLCPQNRGLTNFGIRAAYAF